MIHALACTRVQKMRARSQNFLVFTFSTKAGMMIVHTDILGFSIKGYFK